ncbi:MAG: hypothetical protein CMP72_04380 [Flavobacteriales bacterium]|nr:hypothetical protein [Flavobacteriales bacterium]
MAFSFFACEKETIIIPNNNAPNYDEIPTILLENYVNRLYIDLIGREPLDEEMNLDVQFLRDNNVTIESRDTLISKLQFDTTYVEGDISYKNAYFHRLYEMVKVRMIEGASNAYIENEMGIFLFFYEVDSLAGNLIGAHNNLINYYRLKDIIDSESLFYNNFIDIKEMHRRMLNNAIYDQINMNTFNFVNAAFDNLLFRYPTQNEFNCSYSMIEDEIPQIVLGFSGSNKDDLINIICNSREFYEGIIHWSYLTLLARVPSTIETDYLMNDFYITCDFHKLQRYIMKTDEYAHF